MVRSIFGQPSTAPPYVGRRKELALLEAVRLDATKRHGAVLLIGGEAGIGKSRLLAQLVPAGTRSRGAAVAHAECLERLRRPFGPFRTFLRVLLAPNSAGATRAARLAIAHLVPELANAETTRGDAEFDVTEIFEGVAELLLALAAKRALTLTIDDLQWADQGTLDLLAYLAPRIAKARIVLGLTYRTENLEADGSFARAIAALMREPTVRSLVLAPLPARDVRTLVVAATGDRFSSTSRIVRDIEARSDGNPFFAEELCKAALSATPGGDARTLPLSIRASILQRLSSLTNAERDVLAHAAVLGYRFDPEVLSLVLATPVERLVPALRRFRDLGIVFEEATERVRFRFTHALTRQTVYDDMLAYDARRLHLRIFTTLEALGDAGRHLEELAYHAWECRDVAGTLRYNERAGAAALAVGAAAEASLCYERALSLATDDADRGRLLERLGAAAQLEGRLEEAIATFRESVDIFLQLGDVDRGTFVFVTTLAEGYNRGTLGSVTVREAEAFLERHGGRMTRAVRDDLVVFAARIAAACHDFANARRLLASASPPAELTPGCRHNYYLATMAAQAFGGEAERWRLTARELRAIACELTPRNALLAHYHIAKTGTFLGANEEVERAFADAATIEHQLEFPGIVSYGYALRAIYAYLRGRLTESRAALERSLERSEVFAARVTSAEIGPLLGLALDDPALAKRAIDAVGHVDPSELDINSALMFAGRGAAHVAHGREREAGEEMRRALRSLTILLPGTAFMMPVLAQYLPAQDLPRLLTLVRETPAAAGDTGRSATAALAQSIAAERMGDRAVAVGFAEEAATAYAFLDWPLLKANALERLGRSDDALEIYHRCGALKDVRRLAHRGGAGSRERDVLSARESEIAQLVAAGMTNVAIAERLHLSPKTVEKYVSSIFVKLSVHSRSQLAALVARTAISA